MTLSPPRSTPPRVAETPQINCSRLSRELCERLNWRRDNGGLKDMSCRVALLRMQADRLITLPPPRNPKPLAYRSYPHAEQAVIEPTSSPRIKLVALSVVTSRLHGIDPYTYLVHVLQRVAEHPANRVAELTPRLWEQDFANNPL